MLGNKNIIYLEAGHCNYSILHLLPETLIGLI